MSTTTSDSASPDRLQPAIASARVVIGASLAMFPFGWPPRTAVQATITLSLAAAMLSLGFAQLLATAGAAAAVDRGSGGRADRGGGRPITTR
jgi:hypothetical protein